MMPLDVIAWLEKDGQSTGDMTVLERLARKAEIAHALHTYYKDDFTPAAEAPPLCSRSIEKLVFKLSSQNDLRLLNAALKIAGGILQTPHYTASTTIMTHLDEILNRIKLHART